MSQQSTGAEVENASILLQKIERLEDAAKRGIERSKDPVPGIPPEKAISREQCEWTLQNCAMFRHWINDFGTAGLQR
ncbi:hypothetical protein E2G14_20320 [Salmonella enterica subsp. enterica serovar Reading]|nr:hypothetical protein [Salmonella enterica]ECF2941164.1 hypothetical protein [Salmonella enterica subsp. enterica serovar Reading]